MHTAEHALLELGHELWRAGYRFATVTPATHARVLANRQRTGRALASSLRDVFGWTLPFTPSLLPRAMFDLVRDADACTRHGELWRATVRFSSLDERLFVHSGFPTQARDAVFFGPDTVRFWAFVRDRLAGDRCYGRLVDVGCGSGAGGVLAHAHARAIVLADINDRALGYARINAALAGIDVEYRHSDVLREVPDPIDLVIANPPYLRDSLHRSYRDGGGRYGEALSLRIVDEALTRLSSGGVLLLYTGTAVIDGCDTFEHAVTPLLRGRCRHCEYVELDPDVFGEELELSANDQVERYAAVGLHVVV